MEFHKKKWEYQARQRAERKKLTAVKRVKLSKSGACQTNSVTDTAASAAPKRTTSLMHGFLQRTQKKLLETPWQIIQVKSFSH